MNTPRRSWIVGLWTAVAGLAACGRAGAVDLDQQAWRDECSACHVAYPARFLPAASWKQIMGTLSEHFGTDASVDAATAEKIGRYLASAASSPRSPADPPILRITETRWFMREHDEISRNPQRNSQPQSPANCGACHQGAEAGRFDDD